MSAVATDANIEERVKCYCEQLDTRIKVVEDTLSTKADKTIVDSLSARIKSTEDQLLNLAGDISKVSSNVDLVRTENDEKAQRVLNIVGIEEKPNVDDTDVSKDILKD